MTDLHESDTLRDAGVRALERVAAILDGTGDNGDWLADIGFQGQVDELQVVYNAVASITESRNPGASKARMGLELFVWGITVGLEAAR